MKKFIAISMVFVLITAMFTMLTSCTGGETKNPAVADIVKAITEKYPMDEDMTQVTSENLIANTYGFESDEYSDLAIYLKSSGVEMDEITIVKAADSSKVAGIKEKLENHLNNQLVSTKDYLPEQYAIIEKCSVVTKGDYVCLIISENAEEMVKIFENQL